MNFIVFSMEVIWFFVLGAFFFFKQKTAYELAQCDWSSDVCSSDLGGRDRLIGKFTDGSESRFEALYFDVVPERRLVYTYDMFWQGKKISVSLASVEFVAQGKDNAQGTRLIVTEQHAFLDGHED